MARTPRTPQDIARRFAARTGDATRQDARCQDALAQDALAQDALAQDALAQDALAQDALAQDIGAFSRQTYRLPREQARETAREWFSRFPKAAYMTRVESWRVLDDGLIEFTMRRLPTAD